MPWRLKRFYRSGDLHFITCSSYRRQAFLGSAKGRDLFPGVHRNPVRRGLVEKPEQWRWSSFRDYAGGEPGPVRINDWTVLKMKVRNA